MNPRFLIELGVGINLNLLGFNENNEMSEINGLIPSYWDILLAHKYSLISDADIEAWAHTMLMETENPDWWFSYLVSASELGGAGKYLAQAAQECDQSLGNMKSIPYKNSTPWFSFLGFIKNQRDLQIAYQEINYHAEHSESKEARILIDIFDCFWPKGEICNKRLSMSWASLFCEKDLAYLYGVISPFLKYWDIDVEALMTTKIGDLGDEEPYFSI